MKLDFNARRADFYPGAILRLRGFACKPAVFFRYQPSLNRFSPSPDSVSRFTSNIAHYFTDACGFQSRGKHLKNSTFKIEPGYVLSRREFRPE